MVLGPGPPPKKKDRDKIRNGNGNGSSRDLNTGGQGSSAAGSCATDTTLVVASVEGAEVVVERESGEGWNTRRYQREDEMLWGFDIEEEAGFGLSGIRRTGTAGSGTHYTARNPAVNDLHPPVVSTHPTRKSETRWMLQPPPSAKVMEGKEKANRSRSASGGSYGSGKVGSVGRQGEEKGKKAAGGDVQLLELPSVSRSRGGTNPTEEGSSSSHAAKDPPGQRHDRDPHLHSQLSSSNGSHRHKRPPPIIVSEDNRHHPPSPNPHPRLQSLRSENHSPRPSSTKSHKPAPPSPDALFPPLTAVTSASSLRVLQELVSPNSALKMWTPGREEAETEADVRLPNATEREERELRLPEVESRWPGVGFRFPAPEKEKEAVREGTEGKGRWSMDI